MKRDEMVLGAEHAVESPWHEWASGYGTPLVKAVVREVGVTYSTGAGVRSDGVRCELRAPVRSHALGGRGESFDTHVAGELFLVSSRRVLRPWGGEDDDAILMRRAGRYVEQDYVLATMRERGLPIGARDVTRGVKFELSAFALWLTRVDPVSIAEDAITFVANAAAQTQEEYDEAVEAALEEIRQGLRVTEAELAVESGTGT